MKFSKFLICAVGILAFALPVLAQRPHRDPHRARDDGTVALPGVTVTVSSPEPAGHPHRHHLGQRRLHLQLPAAGRVQGQVRAAGVPDAGDHDQDLRRADARLDATMPQAKVAEEVTVTGSLRDDLDQLDRPPRPCTQDLAQQAPDRAATSNSAALRRRASTRRAQPAPHHLRRAVVREPLPGQRRGRSRTTSAAQPTNLYIEDAIQETTTSTVGGLGRVRPLRGRRGQHAHQVGRQRDPRLVPRQLRQRQVDAPRPR